MDTENYTYLHNSLCNNSNHKYYIYMHISLS